MTKDIQFNIDARDGLKRGVDDVANAVKVTLGPKGRNVIISKRFGAPQVTKDGVSVAKEVELEDAHENMGAQMVKEVASKTNDLAGDGTTTATVLAQAIVKEGLKNVAAGANPMDLKRGIDKAVKEIVADLEKQAKKVFALMADYNASIANYLSNKDEKTLPNFVFSESSKLRYGENPHQEARLLTFDGLQNKNIANAEILQGKEMSYNNIVDADAAWECVREFNDPACVIVKHANPCGVASSHSHLEAYNLAFQTDPTSAFGGIIALNGPLDATTANEINQRQFVEVIIATDYSGEALDILKSKKNIRVLKVDLEQDNPYPGVIKKVSGGILIQSDDSFSVPESSLVCVSKRQPSEEEMGDLMFAWKVAKFVKSNAIVYARNKQTIGIGAGQMSRVISADIANLKAGEEGLEVKNAVMASDAFFPFRDGIDKAASSGIAAIIQPGGSIRDEEVIAAADENGMAMVFTGTRHFRH